MSPQIFHARVFSPRLRNRNYILSKQKDWHSLCNIQSRYIEGDHKMEKKGHNSVFGIFKSKMEVENAVDTLKARGFRSTDISVLMPSDSSTQDFAVEKSTKAPEGATTGATGGALLGGTLGWLAGIGMLAIPGIGPFVAAGPIVAAVAGAGIGGTVGGITGALVGMGIPEYVAKRYEGFVKEGSILISVHVDNREWKNKAQEIIQACGARDIATAGEGKVRLDDDDSQEIPPLSSKPKYSSPSPYKKVF